MSVKTDEKIVAELIQSYSSLKSCEDDILNCCALLAKVAKSGGKLLLCGNGGSSADCDHISGELLKGFLSKRPLQEADLTKFSRLSSGLSLGRKLQYGICAVPLHAMTAAFTAFCNDVDPADAYAQLVLAMGRPGDALICISTSGNSENICNAAIAAKALDIHTVGLTGENGGRLSALSDICIKVPGTETFQIQELHLPVYHCICAALEAGLFGDEV